MAPFSTSRHIDTDRCSRTQIPLTHQSKKLLCCAASHLPQVLHSPPPLCSFFYFLFFKIQKTSFSCSHSPSFKSFQCRPPHPHCEGQKLPPFLFNFLPACLHFHSLPLHPSPLTFSLLACVHSTQGCRHHVSDSSCTLSKINTLLPAEDACALADSRSAFLSERLYQLRKHVSRDVRLSVESTHLESKWENKQPVTSLLPCFHRSPPQQFLLWSW